jgi:hypothetical protein
VIENEETELILCNAKINSKMTVCYVLVDTDYFLLVQLVSDSKMCLLEKTNLADADFVVAADPRNLVVNSQVLYFDSASKCLYVKQMLEA